MFVWKKIENWGGMWLECFVVLWIRCYLIWNWGIRKGFREGCGLLEMFLRGIR